VGAGRRDRTPASQTRILEATWREAVSPLSRPLRIRGGDNVQRNERANHANTQVTNFFDEAISPAKPPFPSSNLGGTSKNQL
jgi:hypothetical protein